MRVSLLGIGLLQLGGLGVPKVRPYCILRQRVTANIAQSLVNLFSRNRGQNIVNEFEKVIT